jgi:hypothetical protein
MKAPLVDRQFWVKLPDEGRTPFELVHDLGAIPRVAAIVAGSVEASLTRAEGRWDERVITLSSNGDGSVVVLVAALL